MHCIASERYVSKARATAWTLLRSAQHGLSLPSVSCSSNRISPLGRLQSCRSMQYEMYTISKVLLRPKETSKVCWLRGLRWKLLISFWTLLESMALAKVLSRSESTSAMQVLTAHVQKVWIETASPAYPEKFAALDLHIEEQEP